MCVVLLTTAHPGYALIVIDNRDEFVLRPTSRPHWWTTRASRHPSRTPAPTIAPATNWVPKPENVEVQHILSARDLQRAEKGTWLGITRTGHFSVLTNYRELDPNKLCQPASGERSRGALVTSWLASSAQDSVGNFAEAMMADGTCNRVGGFSLVCGKLRRIREAVGGGHGLEPMAILSNRAEHPDQIPWIAGRRGETVGLSNTAYDNPEEWPKVKNGKSLLTQVVGEAVEKGWSEWVLREALFGVLDQDTLPTCPEMGLEQHLPLLKESIFIPPIGDSKHREDMERAVANAFKANRHAGPDAPLKEEAGGKMDGAERPADVQTQGLATGMYGTQRQTIILVDWDGNVNFTERALWDEDGNQIEKGKGDMTFTFQIDGWDKAQ